MHYDISVGCGYRCNKADLWWYPTVMLAVVSSKENVSQYLEQDKQTCHWSKVLALIQKQNIFALIFVVTLILLNLSLRITYCIKKKNSWKTVVTSHDLFSFSFSSPLHSCLYFLTISLSLSLCPLFFPFFFPLLLSPKQLRLGRRPPAAPLVVWREKKRSRFPVVAAGIWWPD